LFDWPNIFSAKAIAIDIETRDNQLKALGCGAERGDGFIVGMALAADGLPPFYLPLRHPTGNLDRAQVTAYLEHQLGKFTNTLVFANGGYDLRWLNKEGIHFPNAHYRDVMTADCLLDERNFSYGLDAMAMRYGLGGKAELDKKDKQRMDELPAEVVAPYACRDVELTLAIHKLQEPLIKRHDLEKVMALEDALLPVLVRMSRRGVRVDRAKLEEIDAKAKAKVEEELSTLADMAGQEVTIPKLRKPTFLADMVKHVTGVVLPKTPSGRPATDKATLLTIKHPLIDHLQTAKQALKISNDFCGGVREHLVGDRLHVTFHATKSQNQSDETYGVGVGRLSCTDVNLQQSPVRHPEWGPLWRSVFIADEGKQFISADFSSQEQRMAIHLATKLRIPGGYAFAERWRKDPTLDIHQAVADLCKIKRSEAKTISLGILYGMGGGKLARSLGLPTEMKEYNGRRFEGAGPEAQKLLDIYHERFPAFRGLLRHYSDEAKKFGVVRSIMGRLFHLEDYESFRAVNRVVQGSAADQMKTAMVLADRAGLELQLSVHDECCMSGYVNDGLLLKEIMETAMFLAVPSVVEVARGRDWSCKC